MESTWKDAWATSTWIQILALIPHILDICIKPGIWCNVSGLDSPTYTNTLTEKAIYIANYWLVGMRKQSLRCDFAAFLSIVYFKVLINNDFLEHKQAILCYYANL